jgi:uncharacterized protein YjbJ (UPF0337 family)
MNTAQLKGQWKQVEGEGKRIWGKLTDDDWKLAEGDLEKLAGRIQERYGDAKEKVMAEVGKLAARFTDGLNRAGEAVKAGTSS